MPGLPAAGETCELCYTTHWGVLITCRFWARAVGAAGEYNAGESRAWVGRYPYPDDPHAVAARAALVRRLVDDGWQHVGTGWPWFNDRFRRRATCHTQPTPGALPGHGP
jgi:hypothetical protein